MLLALIILEFVKLLINHLGLQTSTTPFEGGNSLYSIITNLALIHSLGVHDGPTWNYPSWSISVEFYTYIIFGVVCISFKKHFLNISAVVAILCALVIINHPDAGMRSTYSYGILRCMYGFFTGVLVYRLFLASAHLRNNLRNAGIIEICALTFALFFIVISHESSTDVFAPVVFGAIVYLFAFESGIISKALNKRAFNLLGTYSYSIYMSHAVILVFVNWLITLVEKLGADIQISMLIDGHQKELLYFENQYVTDLLVVAYLVVVVFTSSLTYKYIEDPGRRYFYSWANKYK